MGVRRLPDGAQRVTALRRPVGDRILRSLALLLLVGAPAWTLREPDLAPIPGAGVRVPPPSPGAPLAPRRVDAAPFRASAFAVASPPPEEPVVPDVEPVPVEPDLAPVDPVPVHVVDTVRVRLTGIVRSEDGRPAP